MRSSQEVTKLMSSGSGLERSAKEGKSPVGERYEPSGMFPSTTGHEKPCGNPGGPPPKAKYSLTTDSEQVP
jgi:hypothetical protein